MDCREARDLLGAYADNALGLLDAARLNRHLRGCAACRAELAALQDLGATLRAAAPYHRAPAALRTRVLADLARDKGQAQPPPKPALARRPGLWTGWGLQAWANAGMGLLTSCALALAGALWLQRPQPQAELAPQIVASHVRALLSGHPIDVASTDRHTVKPWFNGRLDYAPPVIDLAAQGFPLIGGRVDYVAGRRVAVLGYREGGHPIDLYLLPGAEGDAPPQTRTDAGYALATWAAGGLRYWAITDAEPAVLARFVQALRAAPQ
ncbi:MAG: anti-sigma factor [Proteobacteria bacterium]|nr:anti-sigma factor [Pseudomonadota bacterium]